jgi:hypothetical protein
MNLELYGLLTSLIEFTVIKNEFGAVWVASLIKFMVPYSLHNSDPTLIQHDHGSPKHSLLSKT